MEMFEVCFEMNKESSTDFFSRISIITSYLPIDEPEIIEDEWKKDCPSNMTEMIKKYKFNIIPKELVSRLLVRLHKQMEEKAIWRNGLYLQSKGVKILIKIDSNKHSLFIHVRGSKNKQLSDGIIIGSILR